MKRQTRGFGAYLLILVIVVAGWTYISSLWNVNDSYSYDQFTEAVEKNQVTKVEIHQNRAVPTGEVDLTLTDGTRTHFYVTDVKEVETALEAYGYSSGNLRGTGTECIFDFYIPCITYGWSDYIPS